MKKGQIRNSLLLLLAATIWGTAFVAQKEGMDHVGPFTFTFARSIVGGVVLIPCIWFLRQLKKRENKIESEVRTSLVTKMELLGGICCGLALCAASNFQQLGMTDDATSSGKAGFITALYVVIVPILGLFFKKRASLIVWIGVGFSAVGLYLLCIPKGTFELAYGDLLVLICALLFSVHIMVIDYFSPKGDGVVIACIQFFVCGIVTGGIMLFAEYPQLRDILAAAGPILYAGVLSSGVAYTLQIVGQKNMNPTVASLILCLESVVSAIAGQIKLKEQFNNRELFGCILMFTAIVLAQLPAPKKKSRRVEA